ncbi:MAG TPA: hypothetical protein EYO58_05985 [Flavobacteriales bacterium]|nr:hypothetical protein [Flavobacteriales bacterium]
MSNKERETVDAITIESEVGEREHAIRYLKRYANDQVIKELSDWVQFTKSIKPSVLSMMTDRIEELKQK